MRSHGCRLPLAQWMKIIFIHQPIQRRSAPQHDEVDEKHQAGRGPVPARLDRPWGAIILVVGWEPWDPSDPVSSKPADLAPSLSLSLSVAAGGAPPDGLKLLNRPSKMSQRGGRPHASRLSHRSESIAFQQLLLISSVHSRLS